jgi:ferritin-like metal-binding protein YciE
LVRLGTRFAKSVVDSDKENRMAVDSLRAHLIEELTDLYDAEHQLTKALPKMATSATAPSLKAAFRQHLKETRGQIGRLGKALRQLGETPSRKTCEAMKGLLTEGEEMMNNTPKGALRDVVMITAAQKVEHYEMASYGTVRTYAVVLGEPGVARLLAQTLKEEKAADGKLTVIAERSVNEDAAEEWRAQDEEEGLIDRSTAWVGETLDAASRQLTRTAKRAAVSVGLAAGRSSKRKRSGGKAARTRGGAR